MFVFVDAVLVVAGGVEINNASDNAYRFGLTSGGRGGKRIRYKQKISTYIRVGRHSNIGAYIIGP